MISIDKEKCKNCGICFHECATYVFGKNSKDNKNDVFVRYPELCINCGHCASFCPSGAIVDSENPEKDLIEIPRGMIGPDDMEDIILRRRSIRYYKDKDVPEDVIAKLLNAGFHAGSGHNMQSENFIIIKNRRLMNDLEDISINIAWNKGMKFLKGSNIISKIIRKSYGEAAGTLFHCHKMIKYRRQNNEFHGIAIRNAPVLMLMHGLRKDIISPIHCAVALRNIELLALTMGLGTLWAGWLMGAALINPKKINSMLGVDRTRKIYGAMLIGYPMAKYKYLLPRKEREVKWM